MKANKVAMKPSKENMGKSHVYGKGEGGGIGAVAKIRHNPALVKRNQSK